MANTEDHLERLITEVGESHFELIRAFQGQFITVRVNDSDNRSSQLTQSLCLAEDVKFEHITLTETLEDIAQMNENMRHQLEQMELDSTT